MTAKLLHKHFLDIQYSFEDKRYETISEYTEIQPVFIPEEVNSLSEMKGPWFIQINFGNFKIEGSILLSGYAQSLKTICFNCVKTNESTIIINFLGEVLNVVAGYLTIHPILLEMQENEEKQHGTSDNTKDNNLSLDRRRPSSNREDGNTKK